jgi:anti-anti-sigma regulatory factor
MFTSQSLRAVVKPGTVAIREHRLDDVVHLLDVRGTLGDAATPELSRRVEAALAGGVRWLIVDVGGATEVADGALAALAGTATQLRSRRGELILAGASGPVGERLQAFDVAHRPAVAATVDQAVMILKMLRPKTDIRPPSTSPARRITSLTLPRIEPPATA